jgi:hypothetical protein
VHEFVFCFIGNYSKGKRNKRKSLQKAGAEKGRQ